MIKSVKINSNGKNNFQIEGSWIQGLSSEDKKSVRLEIWYKGNKIMDSGVLSEVNRFYSEKVFHAEAPGLYWVYAYIKDSGEVIYKKDFGMGKRHIITYTINKKALSNCSGVLLTLNSEGLEIDGTDIYYKIGEMPYKYYFPFKGASRFECFICDVEPDNVQLFVENDEKYLEFKVG